MKIRYLISLNLILFALLHTFSANAQCELLNGSGNASSNPLWVSCSGGSYTLFIQSNSTFGAWTIDWGDGSTLQSGTELAPPAFISHTYAAAVANYDVIFTEVGTGCVVTGLVVMEEPVNASIQIPIGGVTQGCASITTYEFTNSSTDVSQNTTFTWDFGDGSPPQVYDHTNAGRTVQYTYPPEATNCIYQVTLSASNYCSFGTASIATFNPVQVFSKDEAAIQASDVLLCYPNTSVTFENVTNRNCTPQGNVFQRQELWNFGDHWGTGADSIIGWRPWPPASPITIDYPNIGRYNVMLIDSNFCGLDTTYLDIDIVNSSSSTITETACDSYTSPSGNFVWTSSNTYMDVIPNAVGCDSTITVNLTVNNSTSSTITETSCDNYTSPSGNFVWTNSNTYMDVIPNAVGCDSTITVNLTVNNSTSSTITEIACDSYTSPSGNFVWTSSNTHMDVVPNTAGCDSTITVDLTINSSTSSTITETVCDNYTSPSGNSTWTISGTYMDAIPNAMGCDSTITVNLTVNNSTSSAITEIACDSYTSPSGNFVWTSSNTYTDVIPNAIGCDSTITVNLTVNNSTSSTITETACDNYTSPSGNFTWTNSDTYTDVIPNSHGCDSLIAVVLTIQQSTSSTVTKMVGESYTSPSGNFIWTESGIYQDILSNSVGCDSVITVNLDIRTDLFLPTLFTPNGDQKNDAFIVRGNPDVEEINFTIFDRDGNKVFNTADWPQISAIGWDGTKGGKEQPSGTYVWVVKGLLADGTPLLINGKETGFIRLLR
ncbi:T9SS type B sorting domain-containing protein [Fulvivirga sp. M361]|uniref:T9SS type B sorting domain-containing protein n=1 Tax=Fulvivirga sp. M361 TaxID=2594266 RepID=UPI0011799FAF|nr:gliding motility-associated C-terminal domain-containing protein [Fulvivirga sp. M361]TRX53378.1 T9SS type B sorting domain-containing protein [Fulvivirga sp. M361]